MRATEVLLLGTVGWTGLGVLGVLVAWLRGEKLRVKRGLQWLIGVWVVYLGVLAGVSLVQKQKVVAIGEIQCFNNMCFTVTGIEEVPRFVPRDVRRLVRVSIRVTNRGRSATSNSLMKAYLVDGQERRWKESSGVNGVNLTAKVAGGSSVTSEPVFEIAGDATQLGLILTQGWRQPGVLVIGDSDSVMHRRTKINLGR
ncbi:hypothetical protein [Tunturiibacter lichenicola]|uniref:hypothetical protein n=1 Tax=Tunturiibacter lichenicola TaxID=2051959 RepID=UPI003D9ABE15